MGRGHRLSWGSARVLSAPKNRGRWAMESSERLWESRPWGWPGSGQRQGREAGAEPQGLPRCRARRMRSWYLAPVCRGWELSEACAAQPVGAVGARTEQPCSVAGQRPPLLLAGAAFLAVGGEGRACYSATGRHEARRGMRHREGEPQTLLCAQSPSQKATRAARCRVGTGQSTRQWTVVEAGSGVSSLG